MKLFLFYFFSFTSVVTAILVISASKPTRALLALIATMFSLAILFGLLGAAFLAMVHLIVYAGAILVLFLFVIMLQGIGAREVPLGERFRLSYLLLACFVGCLFLIAILLLLKDGFQPAQVSAVYGSIETFALTLFKNYLLPFELTSLLLILGIFAAISLAAREEA